MNKAFECIGVVGAGAMGRGIAQLYAQSGIPVVLTDTQQSALDSATAALRDTFDRLAQRGKLTAEQAQANLARIRTSTDLSSVASCDLVIEAIIERLEIKRDLFQRLEALVADDAVLVSNTSSLSITAIAAGARLPARIAGYHFFNPVPLMRVVEVVRGVRTADAVVERLVALTQAAGHVPVVCADTPGFVVNHAGRGYGTEALRALGEGVAPHVTIDRILREQVDFDGQGFKLGPFELLDLTGIDVSHFVMESIYHQYYEEARFRPSVIGAQRVAAGLFGRKSGEGFYVHSGGQQQTPAEAPAPAPVPGLRVWVAPGPRQAAVRALVTELGAATDEGTQPADDSLIVLTPLGLDATTASAGLDARRVVALDTLFPFGVRACKRRSVMTTPVTEAAWRDAAHALFAADGARVSVLRDSPGFIAQRVVAMIVSVGTEIAQQGIATPSDIDTAVRLGLGYPKGPLGMGDHLGAATVLEILQGMHEVTQDPRYRPGLWLRRRAALGLSLLHVDPL